MLDSKESAILEGPQNVGVQWYVRLFGVLVGRSRRKARVVSVDRAEENLETKGLKKLSPRKKPVKSSSAPIVVNHFSSDGVPEFDGRGVRGRKSHKKAADVMIRLPTSVPAAITLFSSGNWLSRI